MIRLNIYAGPPLTANDQRDASTTTRVVEPREVAEILRQIGLEWKTADYMGSRQVVITLDPIEDDKQPDVRGLVRKAAIALEETGML